MTLFIDCSLDIAVLSNDYHYHTIAITDALGNCKICAVHVCVL